MGKGTVQMERLSDRKWFPKNRARERQPGFAVRDKQLNLVLRHRKEVRQEPPQIVVNLLPKPVRFLKLARKLATSYLGKNEYDG